MSNKLFIGSLAWATNDQSLMNHFASIGQVVSARVVTEKMTGRSRGFGFVEYQNAEDAAAAIEKLNGSELDGRNITVAESLPEAPRAPRQ
jgi:RNA recognition motif-containing protein